jgi:hypothetical protein
MYCIPKTVRGCSEPLIWCSWCSLVQKRSAPDTPLITLPESSAGALVQRFREVVSENFKIASHHPQESVHQRTSGRISAIHQCLVWCTPVLHQSAPERAFERQSLTPCMHYPNT